MLRRHRQIRSQLNQIRDAVVFGIALWLAYCLRAFFPMGDVFGWIPGIGGPLSRIFHGDIGPFGSYALLYLIILPGGPLILDLVGFYDRPLLARRRDTVWLLFKGCTFVTVGLILVMFMLRVSLPRSVPIIFGVMSFVLILVLEESLRTFYRSRLSSSQFRRSFILVGDRDETAALRDEFKDRHREGIDVVAELDLNHTTLNQLADVLHQHSANGVIFHARHVYFGQIEQAIQLCELEGVEVWLLADFFRTQISRTSFDDLHGRPMLVFRSAPEVSWQAVIKHMIDFCGALAGLIAVSPILLACAIAVKATSPGPILFRQRRAGLNGRPFEMLKFRSMVPDAEARKGELSKLNEMSGPVFKVTNDPRVTRVGRFLRKWSLDELPQLINVLRGEMSLVGPRPLPVDEVARFDDFAHRRRLSVRPGLTCLWQISGRNNVRDFRDWVRLDLEYIDNWSLWLDFKILLRTVPAVLFGTGAK